MSNLPPDLKLGYVGFVTSQTSSCFTLLNVDLFTKTVLRDVKVSCSLLKDFGFQLKYCTCNSGSFVLIPILTSGNIDKNVFYIRKAMLIYYMAYGL